MDKVASAKHGLTNFSTYLFIYICEAVISLSQFHCFIPDADSLFVRFLKTLVYINLQIPDFV